jgi:hypothetical protein
MLALRELPPKIEALLRTLLYEGYALYPYTCDALKNATPTPFGILFPESYARANDTFAHAALECVARAREDARLTVSFRCLHAHGDGHRASEHAFFGPVVRLSALASEPLRIPFSFSSCDDEDIALTGSIELGCVLESGLARITLRVVNETAFEPSAHREPRIARAEALRRSLLSTHLVLRIEPGAFVSPLEDRGAEGAAARACRNANTWPVLASASDDVLIGAAIVLPDHPELARESIGDGFDAPEIEEAPLVRVSTLTDAERAAIRGADPDVEAMIARALARTRAEHAEMRAAPMPATQDAPIDGSHASNGATSSTLAGASHDATHDVRNVAASGATNSDRATKPATSGAASPTTNSTLNGSSRNASNGARDGSSERSHGATGDEPIPGEDEIDLDGTHLRRGARVELVLDGRRNDASAVLLHGRTAFIERIYRGHDDRVYLGVSIDGDPARELLRDSGRFMYFFPHEVRVLEP